MLSSRPASCLVLAAALLVPTLARAEEPRWDDAWPRFRPVEYAATGTMGLLALGDFLLPTPTTKWRGGILFDDSVRNGLRLSSRSARTTADTASTVGAMAFVGLAFLDSFSASWPGGGSFDTSLQMALIDAETFTFVAFSNLGIQRLTGRDRPYAAECAKDPGYGAGCGGRQSTGSFFSGHSANAFAGATLICTQHAHVALYGGAADTATCVSALVLAGGVGYLRIAADGHYATDVVTGALVGVFAGWVMPSALHYGFGTKRAPADAGVSLRWTVAPEVTASDARLVARGSF